MIGAFSYNGIEAESFELVCKSVQRPLKPASKFKRIDVVGSSGISDFDYDTYSMRNITMRIAYIGKTYQELRSRARQIAAWLSVNTWSKLIINDEPDKYYLAKVTNEIDFESLWESGSADISFDCQPLALSLSKEVVSFSVPTQMNSTFINPGTKHISYTSQHGSLFTISINGSWSSLSISLNGKHLTYNSSGSGSLVIDNINMEATLQNNNVFHLLGGDIDTFLSIKPNENYIQIVGSSINAVITIQYIPLWI